MNEINGFSQVLSDLSIDNKKQEETQELGQSQFLELMIAQLENQDPLSPQDNGEFIAQLAQFSTVEGIDRLNNEFNQFSNSMTSNQALQASSLVGKHVAINTDTSLLLNGSVVSGIVDVPQSVSDLTMGIYNDEGQLVSQIPLGESQAGELRFRWDGLHMEVNERPITWQGQGSDFLPPGEYIFRAMGTVNGTAEQFETALSANVNSVSLSGGQVTLNLAGIGNVSLQDVRQISE